MLLATGHIREVKYPSWLANVVPLPKLPAWQICVDYTDFNKACPNDPFPLPHISQLVDETGSLYMHGGQAVQVHDRQVYGSLCGRHVGQK